MICKNCNENIDDKSKFCLNCGHSVNENKHKQNSKNHKILVIGLSFIFFFVLLLIISHSFTEKPDISSELRTSENISGFGEPIIGSENADDGQNKIDKLVEEVMAQKEVNIEELEIEYKNNCSVVDYSTILRENELYKGTKAVFKGEVVQILYTNDSLAVFRINVTTSQFMYTDTVWATYEVSEDESEIVEGDILTIYGELNGLYTYEAVVGTEITIPSIMVKYIEKNLDKVGEVEEIENVDEVNVKESISINTPKTNTRISQDFATNQYSNIIEKYKISFSSKYSEEEYVENNMSSLLYLENSNIIGYSYVDINNDGLDELIIGNKANQYIYDIYQIVENGAKLIISAEEGDFYKICNNGMIVNNYLDEKGDFNTKIYKLNINGISSLPSSMPIDDEIFISYNLL